MAVSETIGNRSALHVLRTRMKKLLFINGHLNTGGVEKALLDILTHLDYEKYQVDLLLTESLGDYADQIPPQVRVLLRSIEGTYGSFPQVVLKSIRSRDWFSLKMRLIFLVMKLGGQRWVRLANRMLTNGKHYDCVIGFRSGFCTQIAAFAVYADRRITWWHHGSVNVERKSYLEAAKCCDRVTVVSEACREMLAEEFPALDNKLTVIHNMLDAALVRQNAEVFDPYPEKDLLHLVSVGRLAPEKHFENAIYAAGQLKERGFRFQWHLVGDGALRDTLRQKAAELDVTDCFLFEGNQVNPYPYVKNADLFVHPSYVESFGIVVTEALALEVPCVVTRSSGVMDFLVDGENAVLTEQSPEDLTEKILTVLQDTQLQAQLKTNARCPKQFLPDAAIKKIDDLLEAVV